MKNKGNKLYNKNRIFFSSSSKLQTKMCAIIRQKTIMRYCSQILLYSVMYKQSCKLGSGQIFLHQLHRFPQCVWQRSQSVTMGSFEMIWYPEKPRNIIQSFYGGSKSTVRLNDQLCDWFEVCLCVRQGCLFSSLLFAIVMDETCYRCYKLSEDAGFKLTEHSLLHDGFVFCSIERWHCMMVLVYK